MRWGYGKINAKKGLEYIQDHVTGIVDITTMPPGGSQPPFGGGPPGTRSTAVACQASLLKKVCI